MLGVQGEKEGYGLLSEVNVDGVECIVADIVVSDGHYEWDESVEMSIYWFKNSVEIIPTVVARPESIIVDCITADEDDIWVEVLEVADDELSIFGHTDITTCCYFELFCVESRCGFVVSNFQGFSLWICEFDGVESVGGEVGDEDRVDVALPDGLDVLEFESEVGGLLVYDGVVLTEGEGEVGEGHS